MEGLSSRSGFKCEPSDITTDQRGHHCPWLGRDAHTAGCHFSPCRCPYIPPVRGEGGQHDRSGPSVQWILLHGRSERREIYSAAGRAVQLFLGVQSGNQGRVGASRCTDPVSKSKEARACTFGSSLFSFSLADPETHSGVGVKALFLFRKHWGPWSVPEKGSSVSRTVWPSH